MAFTPLRYGRAAWRLVGVVAHIARGLWIIRVRFARLDTRQREACVQTWAAQMLRHLALELVVHGQPAPGPVLLAANHISWADIVILHAARHCRFISKSDVQHWPIVGTLATAAGTLYIARTSARDAMRVVHHMVECLQQGDVLAVFPEGTTGDGASLLPFHGNLLQAAISANAPIQPVALSFCDGATGTTSYAPCYVGDDSLVQSLWRTLCADRVVAVVRFGVPETAQGRDRRQWALALHSTIGAIRS